MSSFYKCPHFASRMRICVLSMWQVQEPHFSTSSLDGCVQSVSWSFLSFIAEAIMSGHKCSSINSVCGHP